MELKSYVRTLRQNLALIIAAAVVGVLGGLGVGLLSPTTYQSQTQLFVSIPGSGTVADLQQGSTFTQERLQTYVEMAGSRAVLQPVIDELALEDTPRELARRVSASTDPETVLIGIEVTDASPQRAQAIAEAVAASLVEVVVGLEDPEGAAAQEGDGARAGSPVQISVAEAAELPEEPASLSIWIDMALGLVVGLVLGVGAALLRSALDTKLRGKEDLRRVTDVPVLATVPADPTTSRTPLITDIPLASPRGEAFRRLRTNLRYAQVGDTANSVLVTSAVAGEGKTTTSINLALVMAQSGKRVALVDADLRRPRVAERLGLENAAGLTTALVGAAEVTELVQPWGDDELYVLTAGDIPPNPSELLESRVMERIVAQLAAEFDLVVIDGPPLLPVADGVILARQVGRVVLVAGVGQVRMGEVQEALTSLAMVDATRVGIVLNRVPASSHEVAGYGVEYRSLADPGPISEGPAGADGRMSLGGVAGPGGRAGDGDDPAARPWGRGPSAGRRGPGAGSAGAPDDASAGAPGGDSAGTSDEVGDRAESAGAHMGLGRPRALLRRDVRNDYQGART
ncbi:polysaccharide biosynthesis tyrosine autokinase [Brevibacterium album]|uniref:polysaccharide biosynthesis tyrosine autokinase n=1 Tax=Brevibacterium album TaxID=417948 RepID=UPI00040343C8|nr:polysaccharide biosynthesis tyrosine autokinase [Brevibacterium album]